MPQLSPHFHSREFRSRDGAEHPIDPRLLEVLEAVRAWADAPVIIQSGYRSPERNAAVGGAKHSYHMQGKAADIAVRGKTPREIFLWLAASRFADSIGLGLYRTWVHVDTRGFAARWGAP